MTELPITLVVGSQHGPTALPDLVGCSLTTPSNMVATSPNGHQELEMTLTEELKVRRYLILTYTYFTICDIHNPGTWETEAGRLF